MSARVRRQCSELSCRRQIQVGVIKKLAILALKLHRALADRLYDLVAIFSEVVFAPCETKGLNNGSGFPPRLLRARALNELPRLAA